MTESQLTERMQQLAEQIAAPPPIADGDLVRGRARVRRRRTAAAGVGAASVLAVGALVTTLASVGGSPAAPVAHDPDLAASALTSSAASGAPDPRCVVDDFAGASRSSGVVTSPRRQAFALSRPQLLNRYRMILARHLDSAGTHLERRASNEQTGTRSDPACPDGTAWLTSYGTKLGWRMPGESGLGMVQVEVSDGDWSDAGIRLAHDAWRAHPVSLPGVRSAEVATDGGLAVVVHRTDGVSVAIDTDALFGNNATTPVSGMELSADDLLAAAADPEFSLS